jgi:hypothetical protein
MGRERQSAQELSEICAGQSVGFVDKVVQQTVESSIDETGAHI